MSIRFATDDEILNWNNLITSNQDGGNIFQVKEFGQIKQKYNGWNPLFIVCGQLYVMILEKKIIGLGKYWYIPKGPGVKSAEELSKIVQPIKKFAKKQKVFQVKLEPEIVESTEVKKQLKKLGLIKTHPVQAGNTIIVDISKSIEEISAGFTSKTRGNIRAGQKTGVTTEIVPINDENANLLFSMMFETMSSHTHLRSFEYFKDFWQSYENAGNGFFIFAKADGRVISIDFIMKIGTKAARKDAGSIRDHSIRGASAFLEYEVIKYLQSIGITEYDLFGSPPSDQIKNPNHPFFGFGTFKAGFNQNVTDYIGCYDIAINPIKSKFWNKYGERIARKISLKTTGDIFY